MKRAAIYTRKSSEEGLHQAFNSLDAQRDACAAYIRSQKAEGWRPVATPYDDGGYSGGSMERPGLKALLADIAATRIDIVVVYKIDRLTRSLADFARMVELFDRHQVSFVSVTQSFNTTSSMGRLTLNVLLSFAQFEREVTGERIRDKIAASKARGMWMGGTLPLGYDRPAAGTRRLLVNEAEAAVVREIFATYLALGSVHALERDLARRGIRSKMSISRRGVARGGVAFSRGALFHLLKNRLYLGEIVHKGQRHSGLHAAIIDQATFDAVQARLAGQTRRGGSHRGGKASSALTGRIFDGDSQPMSPTFAYGQHGALYRYYVSSSLQRGKAAAADDPLPRRVSATAIEAFIEERIAPLLAHQVGRVEQRRALDCVTRVDVHAGRVAVTVKGLDIDIARTRLTNGDTIIVDPADPAIGTLTLAFAISTRRGRTEIIAGPKTGPQLDRVLIRALRAAHIMLRRDAKGMPILDAAPKSPRSHRILRLAFLAPQIQAAILAGTQPPGVTLASLIDGPMPTLWSDQMQMVGLMPAAA